MNVKGTNKIRWVQNASVYGNRGSIAPRDFFRAGAEPRLRAATDYLADLIDQELENILNVRK
jgi:hypothetical protein